MLKRTNKINTLIVSLIIVMAVFFTGCSMTYDNSQTSGTTVAAEATTETTTSSSATASDNTKSTSRTNSKQTSAGKDDIFLKKR